jgi:transcriptional regulator with PAS, ATPase and Fis domain
MVALLANLKKFAQAGVSPVLFYGETGTGKELLAEYYHYWFRPKSGVKPPLVIINCGAIPENLIESELFGYKKGSQSQATEDHPGSLAEADNGVVFLDEINSTQPAFQAKLLRFLDKGELQVLGSGASSKRGTDGEITTSRVTVKILAGSNEDARQLVKDGRMRSDFYYRVAGGMTVHVPPLRERLEDAPLLLQFFFDEACKRAQKQLCLTDTVLRELVAHPWDNIRPMASFMEKLVGVTLDGETLNELPFLPDPPLELETEGSMPEREAILEAICGRSVEGLRYDAMVEAFERFVIEPELKANDSNVKETARKLGMARTTLVDTLKRLKLQ